MNKNIIEFVEMHSLFLPEFFRKLNFDTCSIFQAMLYFLREFLTETSRRGGAGGFSPNFPTIKSD